MKKKITIALTVILASTLIWYLFIKKHDYLITFKVNSNSGIMYDAIKTWGEELVKNKDIQIVTFRDAPFSEIKQLINKNDSSYVLIWKIAQVNDSLSKIKVYVSEEKHSLKNRLLIPFSKAPIEKFAVNTLTAFNKELPFYLKSFQIKLNGIDSIPAAFCACKSVTTTQKEKASKMVLANMEIMNFLMKYEIKLEGKPYLNITSWDVESEKITFDFCFPIKKGNIFENANGIFYKEIKSIPAIKATYNGNYRYSDRTWSYLLNYAKDQHIKAEKLPTELFFNDPQQGGNEMNWKAEIYMPIVE
ncbi:MAG: hypothetical protein CVU01_03625 [Bacteroidetes bacterium HGW-Bacteroidetes-18]|nr:MAG: hypothetical protein CVU01_03625 [Bacteroidetes bacterium HGW-Bacteroidetes-18]